MAESYQPNPYLGATLVAGMITTAAAMVVAVLIASHRPAIVVVTSTPGTAATAPPVSNVPPDASATAAALGPSVEATSEEEKPYLLRAARLDRLPPLEDPYHQTWNDVATLEVPVEPQMMTKPMLETPTIRAVQVQSLTDGRIMAWRLSWSAAKPASSTEIGQFSDAVAIQFPLGSGASFMMGDAANPVQILYWKALWEQDRKEGFSEITDIYPNTWVDLYWSADGVEANAAAESDPAAPNPWQIARSAGNPQSRQHRAQPVEEMVAKGFGSLTALPQSHTVAQGQWRDGRWTVVIARPLNLDNDRLASKLSNAGRQELAIAVWDGSAGNVGGRKHWSAWVPFEVSQ